MKISATALQAESTHIKFQHHEARESMRAWIGERRTDTAKRQVPPPPAADPVQLSDAGKAAQSIEADAIEQSREAVENDPRLSLIRAMIALFTGQETRIFDASELQPPPDRPALQSPEQAMSNPPQLPAVFGIEYDHYESYTEVEQTEFQASGIVRTADGREITFSLSLSMSRSYHEESETSIRLGDARQKKDPLVLNFNGTAAQLSSQRFKFDLDGDGRSDSINSLAAGSGFLVLDRNGDGRANDGSELFGARSGDGFADLAALDSDGNGWIDGGDAVYEQLGVWTRDGGGNDRLASLGEYNVGALSLERFTTPFEIRASGNELLGQIKSTGIFLQEDGSAGTMQQIDLTV